MANWRTLLPQQKDITFGSKKMNVQSKKARANDIRTKLRGFAKLSGKLGASTLKRSSNASTSVEESLRRFFELKMRLRSPQEMHLRLCLSGKPNWVPQRFLMKAPKQKTGRLGGGRQRENKPTVNKSTFDKAAEQVAGAFGNDNSDRHERMRSLLQIFSYYSDLGQDGIRTHGYDNFIKLIDNCQLARFTEYKPSNEMLCWKVFAKIKRNIDPIGIRLNFEAFVDGFSEIVPHVFRTSSRPPQELALELVNNHIMTRANRVRSDPLTLALLWNEKAQAVITKYHWQLQVIFKHFADLYEDAADTSVTAAKGLESRPEQQVTAVAEIGGTQTSQDIKEWMRTPGSDDTIDWQEFHKLLQCYNIVGLGNQFLSEERARVMFDEANLSEIADADVDRLCWHEYVEALGRCALELYPLEDSGVSKSFGIEKASVRFSQGQRRLTTGMKTAIQSAFRDGPTAKPPQNHRLIVRCLSPRAKLLQKRTASGIVVKKRQQPIGHVAWGRDFFTQKTSTFEQIRSPRAHMH